MTESAEFLATQSTQEPRNLAAHTIEILPLKDSTSLHGDGEALRARWREDGVFYLKRINDPELMAWAEQHFRKAHAAEKLIDLEMEAPVWTSRKSDTWRPCDASGTTVWHEIVKQPNLNAVLRLILECDPIWLPIAAHRSAFPRGRQPESRHGERR